MTEKQDFTKFKFTEKFDRLPQEMSLDHTGSLRLERTKIDMIPEGLELPKFEQHSFVIFYKKPVYIAPDFQGVVLYEDGCEYSLAGIADMTDEEIAEAKARYIANREMVEKPRYTKDEDGTLSLCSLPKNMKVVLKPCEGYCLDLTRTDVIEKQDLSGFKNVILYPKRQDLSLNVPQKVVRHHKGRQMVHQKPRTRE